MRRENSLAMRMGSKEVRGISKTKKKRKNACGALLQRPVESVHSNDGQQNLVKFLYAEPFKKKMTDRLARKLQNISKELSKILDRQQMKYYTQLTFDIKRWFDLAYQADNPEETNAEKKKKCEQYLDQILERQKNIIKKLISPHSPLNSTMHNGSGVISNELLIAREMSPKNKLNFAGFSKRPRQDEGSVSLHDQLAKKDCIIKNLFQKIDKLEWKDRYAMQQERPKTFHKCLQSISKKLRDWQDENDRTNDLFTDCQRKNEQLKNTLQENKNFMNENQRLNQNLQLYEEQQKHLLMKYDELSEQFEQLVKEKLQLENQQTKLKNYCLYLQLKYPTEVADRGKKKLEDFIKEEIIPWKEQHELQKVSIKQKLASFWAEIKKEIEIYASKMFFDFYETKEMMSEQCFNLQRKYNELEQIYNILKEEKQFYCFTVNALTQKQRLKKQRLKIQKNSQIIQQERKLKKLKLQVFSIYEYSGDQFKHAQDKIPKNNRNSTLCLQKIETFAFWPITSQKCSVDAQTEAWKGTQTAATQIQQIIKIDQQTEPFLKTLDCISNCINEQIIAEPTFQAETRDSFEQLEIVRTIQICCCYPQTQFSSQECQTQEFHDNISEPFEIEFLQQVLPEVIAQQEQQQTPSQIIRLLQQAEQCLLIPQIQILKNSIVTYREQLERLRVRIRQLQKQREQDNVFNFKL